MLILTQVKDHRLFTLPSKSMKSETKVKGFTLNFKNSQVINHNSMSDMIKNNIKVKTIEENKITKNSKKTTIENKYQ
jgi:hypothetical protein